MWFNMANTCWVTGILFLCYLANFGQATQPVAKIILWLKFKAMLKSKAGQEPMKFVLEVEEGKLKLYAIESEVARLCPTLCDPMDCSLSASSIHWIFQARVLEWIAIYFSRGSSQPRYQTQVSRIAGRRFTFWATREALRRSRYFKPNLLLILLPTLNTHQENCAIYMVFVLACGLSNSYSLLEDIVQNLISWFFF